MDDQLGPSDPAAHAVADEAKAPTKREPPPRVSPGQFVGALAVNCLLFFVLLAVFAVAGLGPLGIWPAIIVATTLTGRVTKIRRVAVLVGLAILSFVIVVGATYAITIAVYLNASR